MNDSLTANQTPSSLTSYDPLINRVLESRYRIDEEVGRGGMGIVYRGTDLTLSRPVAIKTISHRYAKDEQLTQFIREARTLAQIENPRLVPVYAVGHDEGYHYLVMKFLEGETLEDRLKREGRLPSEDVRGIVKQVCLALKTLHFKGLVHRDLKPANLMIAPDGTVTVMDLGIAKQMGESHQSTSSIAGTPKYMPPEAVDQKPLDARADLYSLGVIAFYALTGQPPFDGPTTMSILYQHAHQPPPELKTLVPNAPKNLISAIEISLEKNPEHRFQSADECAAAFSHQAQFEKESSLPIQLFQMSLVLAVGVGLWIVGHQAYLRMYPPKSIKLPSQPLIFPEDPALSKNQRGQDSKKEGEQVDDFDFEIQSSSEKPKVKKKRSKTQTSKKAQRVKKTQKAKKPKVNLISVRLSAEPDDGVIVYELKGGSRKRLGLAPIIIRKPPNVTQRYLLKHPKYLSKKVTITNKAKKVVLQSPFGN